MLRPLVEPSLDRGSRAGKTAFERNMLPGFARWFVEIVERYQPDYLVPAETKGARLLETVLDYARDVLGIGIQVPILYRTALAYVPRELLRNCRVLVLDDAIHTGNNLALHRCCIEEFGVEDVREATCIGFVEERTSIPTVECYRPIDDPEVYREHIWQLTELVVARGLPPEVDHHMFELRLPGRLPRVWSELEAALGAHGNLSVDAPRSEWGTVQGLTLHFPRFPTAREFPTEGPVRSSGPNKLRFFPDEANDRVFVVPVSFPTLDLSTQVEVDPELGLSAAAALGLLEQWSGGREGVGQLLVKRAARRDPETVFRALSACAEADLIRGLGEVLGRAFPEGGVSISAERDLFHRLYGREVGELAAEAIDAEASAALDSGAAAAPEEATTEPPEVPLFLDEEVVQTTSSIAKDLKRFYEEMAPGEATAGPRARIGRSLAGISETLDIDRLLSSRCMDYGLALTTLVPYVDEKPRPDGALRLERKYRVSEVNRGEEPYEDIDVVNQQIADEIFAFVSQYLSERCGRYQGRHLPLRTTTQMVAVMRSLLDQLGVKIEIQPNLTDPLAVVRRHSKSVVMAQSPSLSFVINDAGEVEPTEHFSRLCREDKLRIDRRQYTTQIEAVLDLMRALLDSEMSDGDLNRVLTCWAISSDQKLGLTHIQHALDLGLDRIEAQLKLIARGEKHDPPLQLLPGIRKLAQGARELLDLLGGDWAEAARAPWSQPSKRESLLLATMAAPADRSSVFELPRALCSAVEALAAMTEDLDAFSVAEWNGEDQGAEELPTRLLSGCKALESALTTLRGTEEVEIEAIGSDRAAITTSAEALGRVAGILRAFTAAIACDYRGVRGQHSRSIADDRRRTVLFADIEKSTEHALKHSVDVNFAWKNSGLNLLAQWAKAFGGLEDREREGDCLWPEFEQAGDAALLCGALVQAHAHALRSVALPELWWGFRIAVDVGQIRDGDRRNAMALALDRPAKLAKAFDDDESVERVLATAEAIEACSAVLREQFTTSLGKEVTLTPAAIPGAKVEPSTLDGTGCIKALAAQVETVAAKRLEGRGAEEEEAFFEAGDLPEDGSAAAEAAGG
jgi:class 3 adenylate cyclase